MMRIPAILCAFFASPVAGQDLVVQFSDAAPKHNISVHAAGCNITEAVVLIDLAGSKGGLIFAATGPSGGAPGKPVEITHGQGALGPVHDGDRRLQLLVKSLAAGETLDLLADLDNATDEDSRTVVSGAELEGASVQLALSDRVLSGTFDTGGKATIALPIGASVCLASAG